LLGSAEHLAAVALDDEGETHYSWFGTRGSVLVAWYS
jgi:hypothetical protein